MSLLTGQRCDEMKPYKMDEQRNEMDNSPIQSILKS